MKRTVIEDIGRGMLSPRAVVLIDAGHGGGAFGAMWPTYSGDDSPGAKASHARRAAAVEKDITLALAQGAAEVVDASGWPVAVELTRDDDSGLTLAQRCALADKHGATLAISLHCDTNDNRELRGLWCYVRDGDAEGTAVARDILCAAPRPMHRQSHTPVVTMPRAHWTSRAHSVLRDYQCAAVLVECGFVSNDSDRSVLNSDAGRAQIVTAIMSGIAGHWRREDDARKTQTHKI